LNFWGKKKGGDRIWPQPGYWSLNEHTKPTPCTLTQACPGSLGSEAYNSDGSRKTNLCADGYAGVLCSQCDQLHYMVQGLCFTCLADSNDRSEFIAYIMAAFILIGVLCLSILVLSNTRIHHCLDIFVGLQFAIVVGQAASQRLASDGFANFIRVLSLLNFDVQMVKFGCSVPRVTFMSIYWITIILVIICAICFTLTAALHTLINRNVKLIDRETIPSPINAVAQKQPVRVKSFRAPGASYAVELDQATASAAVPALGTGVETNGTGAVSTSQREPRLSTSSTISTGNRISLTDNRLFHTSTKNPNVKVHRISFLESFRRRTLLSLMLLAELVYLQLMTRSITGVVCALDSTGVSRLVIEQSVVCWEGQHLGMSVFIFFLLIGYGVGYPAFVAYVSLQSINSNNTRAYSFQLHQQYGVAYRDLQPRFIYWRALSLLSTLGFCLELSVSQLSDSHVRVGAGLIFSLLDVIGVPVFWPYIDWSSNVTGIVVRIFYCLYVTVLLVTISASAEVVAGIVSVVVIFWFAVISSIIFRCIYHRRFVKFADVKLIEHFERIRVPSANGSSRNERVSSRGTTSRLKNSLTIQVKAR